MATGPSSFKRLVKASLPRVVTARRLRPCPTRAVLLTFDDGPDPEVTPAVLDRLEAQQARAVFFVIGYCVDRAPHLVREILERGHQIGNHSWSHPYTFPSQGRPPLFKYYRDLRECQKVIQRSTGVVPRLFRPPGGRLTPATLLVPRLLGMRCVTWSCDVNDLACESASDAMTAADRLLASVHSGDILLLHDTSHHVLHLLDRLLPQLRAAGYDLACGTEYLS
jgi:peptidoglycan/xylan/chitin deacetylase (PgdA/CDA1 family)